MCTHHQPNGLQVLTPDVKFSFAKEKIWRVTLGENYKASARECASAGNCDGMEIDGTWTNIYDQAQTIDLSNGMRFIANYRYDMDDNLAHATDGGRTNQASIPHGLSAGDGFVSDCG